MALTEDQVRGILVEYSNDQSRFAIPMVFISLGLAGIISGLNPGGNIGDLCEWSLTMLMASESGIASLVVGLCLYWFCE